MTICIIAFTDLGKFLYILDFSANKSSVTLRTVFARVRAKTRVVYETRVVNLHGFRVG